MKNNIYSKIKAGMFIVFTLIFILGASNVFAADTIQSSKSSQQWITLANMNNSRINHTSVTVNGKIYVIGGMDENRHTLASLEVYDPLTNTWTKLTNMRYTRNGHTSVVLDGKIYTIGGTDGNNPVIPNVEVYNPETNAWTTLTSMNNSRIGHVSTVLNGKIYVMGGMNAAGNNLLPAEVYDPSNNTWTTLASMKDARYYPTSAVLNGKIYVIGGRSGDNKDLSSAEVYDPSNNTWTTLASMKDARYYPTSAVLNGKIYVIGGSARIPSTANLRILSSVEMYDPSNNTWTTLASMKNVKYCNNTIVLNGKICTMGGSDNTNLFSSMEEYNPTTNTWTNLASMKDVRSQATSVVLNNIIYMIGGNSDKTSALSSVEAYQVSTIELNKISDLIKVGDKDKLIATTTPAGIGVTWTSSDSTIATVDSNGVVTGVKVGTATITATTANGETAICSVTVTDSSNIPTPSGNRATLTISMNNGLIRQYDLSASELSDFLTWYDNKSKGVAISYYTFNVSPTGPYLTKKDYISFDNINHYEVQEYNLIK